MANDTNILEMRYTLPGLGYFLVLYICLAISLPTITQSKVWTALGALALVGTVPVGYLVHQLYLLWNFMMGRTEHYRHIQKLYELLENRKTIQLYLYGKCIQVSTCELKKELKRLGKEYVNFRRGTFVVCRRKLINETHGYLTPLHDVIFMREKIHDYSYKGPWTHARITRALLLTFGLAWYPWIFSWGGVRFPDSIVYRFFSQVSNTIGIDLIHWMPEIPDQLRVPIFWIASQMLILGIVAGFVSWWSRNQSDLDEQFLVWLYDKYLDSSGTDCH